MNVRRVTVIVHPTKPEAKPAYQEIADYLRDRRIEITDGAADLVISLGGDGTLLRAAQHAHSFDAPLLGVNLGTLGYLTEVDSSGAVSALNRILAADVRLEERMALNCTLTSGGEERSFVGFNEVLVERSAGQRLVRLAVNVGGEDLATFNADGMIVATPTGSTAYALSAGGPIVSPRASCLILVPVSAHMIFTRPFVVAPDETIEIVVGDRQEAELSLDGALGCELKAGSQVVVERHGRPLRLVRLAGPDFLQRLRVKLGLPQGPKPGERPPEP